MGFMMMKSLPAEILLEALVMLVCMLEKMLSMIICPCQEDNCDAHVNKDKDAVKVW